MTTSFQIDDDLQKRIEPLLNGTQSVSQFCQAATIEKVNRMEKRDEQARRKVFLRDVEILTPIVEEVLRRIDRGKES